MPRSTALVLPALLSALALATALSSASAGGTLTTERVSVATDGSEATGASDAASVSAGGGFVAFASEAPNLVANDTLGARDIFVRDLNSGTTERVSVGIAGAEANNHSFTPSTSGDGRYVAFASFASNLVANDLNTESDIFVYDRTAGTTERVSVASNGTEGGNESVTPSISASGRYVTFTSLASNLIVGDTNNDRDVFLHDRDTDTTELISQATDGTQGNFASGGFGAGPGRVSADGSFVVFGSFANNLVASDTNSFDDVFVRNRTAGTTERASLGDGEEEADEHSLYGAITDNGRYVAFYSDAETLVPNDDLGFTDIFLRDMQAGTTTRISVTPDGSEANGDSRFAMVSGDGSSVVFESGAPDLVAGDGNGVRDIFRYDTASGVITRVSVASDGAEGHGDSSFASTSSDGLVTAYQSAAPDLVSGDTLGLVDAFATTLAAPPAVSPTATAPGGGTTSTPTGGGTPNPEGTPAVTGLPATGGGTSSGTWKTGHTVLVAAALTFAGAALLAQMRRSR
jgi:Tol biopolymer transport system component